MRNPFISPFFSRVLCQNVFKKELSTEVTSVSPSQKKSKRTSSPTTLCFPPMDSSQLQELSSIVAVNLRIDTISWAKICLASNRLTDWNIVKVPPEIIKSDPITIHHMTQKIYHNIPDADLYVMDQLKTRAGSKNPAASSAFITKLQLLSMLISMINFQKDCPIELPGGGEDLPLKSKVVFLKPFLVMRLFNLLVGDECVSVEPTVTKMFGNEPAKTHSPLDISREIQLHFKGKKSDVEREHMGIALLMIVTFKELLIHKNPSSYKVLLKNY